MLEYLVLSINTCFFIVELFFQYKHLIKKFYCFLKGFKWSTARVLMWLIYGDTGSGDIVLWERVKDKESKTWAGGCGKRVM